MQNMESQLKQELSTEVTTKDYICVHTLCGCGETLYMNCQTLGIVDRKLNSTSVIAAINEAQSLVKREFDLLSNELNTILNSKIEISRY